MFGLTDKIDKALEEKSRVRLLDKMGRCFNGTVADSWVRVSGGKLRGKVVFSSDEKGDFEIDANDILDVLPALSAKK